MVTAVARRWAILLAPVMLATIGGCASFLDLTGTPRSGYQANGTYVVSPDEEKLACRQIQDRLELLSRQLQVLPQQAALERENTPATVGSVFGRAFGGPDGGLRATGQFQRAQAESDALKGLLDKKQCSQSSVAHTQQ